MTSEKNDPVPENDNSDGGGGGGVNESKTIFNCEKCKRKVDKANHDDQPIYVCKKCGKDVCYNCAASYPAFSSAYPIWSAGCPICKTWKPAFIPWAPYTVPKGEERSHEYYAKYPL